MWGHIPKSILIPLNIGNNGFCDSTVLLRSILHSALKIGGWRKYIPTTIKIVLNKKDAGAIAAFDAASKTYDTLRGAPNKAPGLNPPAIPIINSVDYGTFMKESNDWMGNMFASGKDVNPTTEFQAFAANIYTSSYCPYSEQKPNALHAQAQINNLTASFLLEKPSLTPVHVQ